MKKNKSSILLYAFLILIFLYVGFIAYWENYSRVYEVEALKKHGQVIQESLWNFDSITPLEYLRIISEYSRYETLTIVLEGEENPFIEVTGNELSSLDQLLLRINFIRKRDLTSVVYYEQNPIAVLEVTQVKNNLYIYLYVLLIEILIFIGFYFYQHKNILLKSMKQEVIERVKEIRKIEGFFSYVLDSIPAILISVNKSMEITQWNKKATEELSINRSMALGKELFSLFDALSVFRDDIQWTMANSKKREILKCTDITIDPDRIMDINLFPLVIDEVEGVIIMITDVSEKTRLQEQLHQGQKMDAIGQLAGGVAHDFNNMLGGIMGAAELIKSRIQDDEIDPLIDIILEASRSAADLTGKLLTFGRKNKVTSTAINLNRVIEDCLGLLEKSLDRKIKIHTILDADRHFIVGDESIMKTVFLNLCINAAHAMPDGGELLISSENIFLNRQYCESRYVDLEPGEYIVLKFIDTGIGIPDDMRDKIFEPFFTTKEEGKGTGLGLAAVHSAVQEHNGEIQVESSPGKGSVFTIKLPCTESIKDSIVPTGNKIDGRGCILLVDDEKVIRITAQKMLESMGYDVLCFGDSREALEKFKEESEKIDLVFSDMIMPNMNGEELFSEMKKIDPSLKMVISSGFTSRESLQPLFDNGLAGFIHKPYREYELTRLLGDILN